MGCGSHPRRARGASQGRAAPKGAGFLSWCLGSDGRGYAQVTCGNIEKGAYAAKDTQPFIDMVGPDVFKFAVDQEHSHWRVQVPGQTFMPAYKGSVWIDDKTSQVLRVEMQAVQVMGLGIERDEHFTPKKLSEVKKEHA